MYQEETKQVLIKQHKEKPTLIQKETYDAIRNGASLVGLAKTGTGKTLHCLVWKERKKATPTV